MENIQISYIFRKRQPLNCLTWILLFFFSCDAPHNNPFDPGNESYKIASIKGIFKTETVPNKPLGNIKVQWRRDNKFCESAEDGSFFIDGLISDDDTLNISSDEYNSVSKFIEWKNAKQLDLKDILLNSKPTLDSSLISISVSNYKPIIEESVYFVVKLNDAENDVKIVYLKNHRNEVVVNLDKNNSVYEKTIDKLSDLKVVDAEQLVGDIFQIYVLEGTNKIHMVGMANINRILKLVPECYSPINNEMINSDFIQFVWKKINAGFEFVYYFEIFEKSTSNRVYSSGDIASSKVSLYVDSGFAKSNAEYYWVIWCKDKFGNKISSKAATFRFR